MPQPARYRERVAPKTLATAFTTRSTSVSVVRQLVTLIRMARRPRQVVPPKKASPVFSIAAITQDSNLPDRERLQHASDMTRESKAKPDALPCRPRTQTHCRKERSAICAHQWPMNQPFQFP